ncbi:MAG: TonB-dependent receptor [Verrucomicrobiaceae bacterium]|nr:TonB-dependent receptor [Verrucomicrobiaceae bacterium]
MTRHIEAVLKISLGTAAFIATLPAAHAQTQQAGGLEEVFVTARKRDEGVQTVPVSIAALSSELLDQRNVHEVQDLNSVVPGFHFGAEGGKGNTQVILRGLSKIPLGEGVPAVVTYFGNIALPAHGGNTPTYDIANIQVLKGPQGTLFGRNTLGGAVVITPVAPDYQVDGYIKGDYGTKNYRSVEGAVNVPIVDEKVALRVAGEVRRQDGLDKNLSGGPDFNNLHQQSYRISLLLNPTDKIESTTIYDHFTANETNAAERIYNVEPGFFANPALAGLGSVLLPQLYAAQAAQHAAGFHSAATDVPGGGGITRNLWGISNDTSFDTGVATIRNIFGYRRVTQFEAIDTADAGQLTFPVAPGVNIPFALFDAGQTVAREYWSDEFQIFGTAFDDRLDWIVGAFYNKDQNTEGSGTTFTQFAPFNKAAPAITGLVKNTNKAIFEQTGLDLSQWTVDGLKFNLGLRYTWDNVWACGGGNPANSATYLTTGQCKALAGTTNGAGDPIGVGTITNKGENLSWTVGFDWQIDPDTLVYVTSRRGYRGVNVNTPAFQTQFTTGGPGCEFGTCPDLRPFQKTKEEKLTDIEIGVKNDWNIGDVKGRIDVAGYVSKYKGAVQFLNVQALGIPNEAVDAPTDQSVGVNAADLTISGVEADLTVIPVPSLTLTLSGAYTDQKVDKVAPPVGGLSLTKDQITLPSPKFSGSFAFAWTTPIHPLDGDVVVGGDYYHTEKFSGQGGNNLPGYSLANFRLDWKGIAKTQLDVAAYLKNAFDANYYSSPDVFLGEGFPVEVNLQGNPREWGVEAKYRF